uniref:Uncharacterized protein n=1 Tax=Lobelia urens TaxID=1053365 RepID=A0A1Z2R517_9ASTR|nr:hypothetical protein Lo_ure1Pt0116 [Lobelia urens]ASA38808.1 hypothetical protein Lo_ure1Pt0116 [Lobelia urens]
MRTKSHFGSNSGNLPSNDSNCHFDSSERNIPKTNPIVNGKEVPELETESLFPQTSENGRQFRKEHEPELTCAHWPKCHGYKHSYNTGHCKRTSQGKPSPAYKHSGYCKRTSQGKPSPGYKHSGYCKRTSQGKPSPGYKHSYNTGHCEIRLEAFQSGSAVGERWINAQIRRLAKNRTAREALQTYIHSRLTEAAQKPTTDFNTRELGFWHGAFLRLKTIIPKE